MIISESQTTFTINDKLTMCYLRGYGIETTEIKSTRDKHIEATHVELQS